MKHLFIFLFILCIHKSQAQYYGEDSISQARNQILFKSDYCENFDMYTNGGVSIILDARPINIPVECYRQVFQLRRDSLFSVKITEVEEKSEKIMFAGHKISCSYSYTWFSSNDNKNNEVDSESQMTFFFWNSPYKEFTDSMLFELYKNDSLRYILHKRLRTKHEAYLRRRMNISINIKELLSHVEQIKLYEHDLEQKPSGYKYPEGKAIFSDTTIITHAQLKKSITGKQKIRLLQLLSNDAEWLTKFNRFGFIPDYTLLLSDRDNNYIGKIRITGSSSGGDGLGLSLKVSDNYFYHTYVLKYKGFDEIRAIVDK